MSETKLDSLLLKYNLARNQRVAVTTYQSAPPGAIDIERHALGNPFCFRTTKIVDQGFILKTIIIADPTLGMNHNADPSQVAELINLLLNKDNSTIYLWTGEFIRINTSSDFWSHYRACTSLLHAELAVFKEKEQLNQDNLIVLDNTSLQAIAHYIINASDELPQDTLLSHEKESIEPHYFTSDTLMLYDKNQQQRLLAWHEERDYPLHLKLNGFSENKLPEFISYVQNYDQIFLYFNELIYSDLEIWLTHLMQLPASQIVGVYQGVQLSPKSTNALLTLINQMPQLRFLSINLPITYNNELDQPHLINLANLDFSKHQQLNYLSITSIKSRKSFAYEVTCSLDLNTDTISSFLKSLPSSLNYLYLPFTWTYSLALLDEVLTKNLPYLKEVGSTDEDISNPYSNPTPNIRLLDSDKHQTISLPRVKIFKRGQLLPIEGIETNQPYKAFALDITGITYTYSNELDFTPYYQLIREHCMQPHMTLTNAVGYIDNIINENNLYNLSALVFLENHIKLDTNLLLLISTRMPKTKELIFNCWNVYETKYWPSNVFTQEMGTFLNDHVWRLDTLEFTVVNEVDSELLDNLFSKLKVKQHILIGMDYENIADAPAVYFEDVQSICLRYIDDAENCRNSLPNAVISRDYSYQNYQGEYDLSVDELKKSLLESQQRNEESDYPEALESLINDTDTVENPSTRLSARQLFRTLDGQAVPVHYNRMRVRSITNNVPIENGVTIHPGKMFRYDHAIPDDARVYEATHCYDSKRSNDHHIIPMLHPQDTLYKIVVSHPIELSYDSKRKVYLVKGLTPNVPVTITYQFHSTAYIAYKSSQFQQNPKHIIPASSLINPFLPLFYLFNSIHFTPEGIDGLDSLNALPAAMIPPLICAYFADFGSGQLVLTNNNQSPHDIDDAIFHQKVGACRHRSNLAFKMLSALAEQGICTIEANLTTSDVHQFLELLIGDQWVTVCLGGFNSQIDLQNTHADNATQAPQYLSHLEEISVSSLFSLNQPATDRYFPYEDNIEGWGEMYAETEQNIWDSIIQGFDPYSSDLMKQSDTFQDDVFFDTVEVKQEVQKARTQKLQPPENSFLLTYPKLSFTNSQDYRWWLKEQLKSNNNCGEHLLLVVDSINQQIEALQRDTYEHIVKSNGYFASISDFQHIKFAELHVDEQGNKDFRANELGALIEEGGQGDVLWINIYHYQAATINPLFDHRKKLRDKQIPREVLLIAVMEDRQFQEMSDDFTSRFSSIYKLDAHNFQPTLPQRTEGAATESCFIFGEPLLSFEQFFGYYAQNHGQLQWHEGWLTQQITKGVQHITLINPPTDLDELNLVMHSLQQGYYYSNGERITVPHPLGVTYKKQPYNFPPCTIVSAHQKITIDFVLNKTTLTNLLRGTYELLDKGSVMHHPSIDASNSEGCTVLLSESLSDEEWYTLLDADLPLRLALAPGVILPNSLAFTYTQDDSMISKEYTHLFPLGNCINWVESDAFLELMRNADAEPSLPPIYLSHDALISDLLGSFVAQEGQSLRFVDTEFNHHLRQGKSLVLYGNPNSELRHFLESLLCARPYIIINGAKQYVTGPLSIYFTPNPDQSLIPVQRMTERTPEPINKASPLLLDPHHDVESQLLHQVIPRIREQRISIISGLPQSGKSRLLHQLACTDFTIHQGMNHLDSWLARGGILLIDHCHYATLEEHSLIEQVHHVENQLYLKGQFYPLTPQHKMILMVPGSKPLTSFFTVNTPSVHCEPFNLEIRLDALIKPFWQRLNTYNTQECWPIIKSMLNQLQGLNGFSGVNQLLMALAYIDELAQHQSTLLTANNQGSLKHLCDLTLCLLCPDQASKELKNSVQQTTLALITRLLPKPLGVTITPLQSLIVCNLMLHLRLVERARSNALIARLLVKGIIIEGSPGIGKTYLTQKLVHAMGYQEVTDSTMDVSNGYVLAPTDDLRLCKEQLMLAKEKGYLILFDELNTLPEEHPGCAERSLIAQLIEALEPNHLEQCSTGFHMVASQNTAATFGNRLSLPKELSLRCITLHPGEFRKQDYHHLSSFLKAKEPEAIATEMKKALRQYKQAPNKYKKPTVRSLIGFLSPPQVEQSGNKRKRGTEEHQPRKTPAKKIKR